MDELGVERSAGPPQKPVKKRHLARDGIPVGTFDGVHQGDQRILDPVFHGGLRTHPNTVAALVKRDCNPLGKAPPRA